MQLTLMELFSYVAKQQLKMKKNIIFIVQFIFVYINGVVKVLTEVNQLYYGKN